MKTLARRLLFGSLFLYVLGGTVFAIGLFTAFASLEDCRVNKIPGAEEMVAFGMWMVLASVALFLVGVVLRLVFWARQQQG